MYSRILCKLDTIMAGFLVFDLYKVFSSYTLEGCGCNFIVDFYLHPQCVLYVIKLTLWISCLGCKIQFQWELHYHLTKAILFASMILMVYMFYQVKMMVIWSNLDLCIVYSRQTIRNSISLWTKISVFLVFLDWWQFKSKNSLCKDEQGIYYNSTLDHKLLYMNITTSSNFNSFSLSDLVAFLDWWQLKIKT